MTNQYDPTQEPITVLGAGSFGTCLAIQASRQGHPVKLWGRNADEMIAMQAARVNQRYLPDAPVMHYVKPWRTLSL